MDRSIFTNYTNNRITSHAHTPAYTHNHTYAIKYLSPNVEHLHFLCFGWDVCVWESECVFLTSGNKKTRKIAEPEFVQMFLIRPSQWWEGGQRASKNNRKKIIIFSFFFSCIVLMVACNAYIIFHTHVHTEHTYTATRHTFCGCGCWGGWCGLWSRPTIRQ